MFKTRRQACWLAGLCGRVSADRTRPVRTHRRETRAWSIVVDGAAVGCVVLIYSVSRPLVSYVLLAYNQERFIEEAVRSALDQTYTPLEIIVSDDRSTDHTFDVIRRTVDGYKGPHRLVVQQNSENLGIGAHVSKLTAQAEAGLVVIGAGDDISLPHRVQRLAEAIGQSREEHVYVFSDATVIDASGAATGSIRASRSSEHYSARFVAARGGGAVGCSSAWTSSLQEVFGPIPDSIIREDMVLPFRATLIGSFIHIPESLVRYRRHGSNVWKMGRDCTTVDAEMAQLRNHAAGNVAVEDCRLADLDTARRAYPYRTAEYNELRRLVLSRRRLAGFEFSLSQATSRSEQRRLVAKALHCRACRRSALRWGITLFAPYLRTTLRRVRSQWMITW